MWYPAAITTPAVAEPLLLQDVCSHLRISVGDDDAYVYSLISAARDHVERYTGTRLMPQTVAAKCDGWADFERLPEGPVQSISSITYVDTAGTTQTLDSAVYELRSDGLDGVIALAYGQTWPAIRNRSRITVNMVVGYSNSGVPLPPSVNHAMFLLISHLYDNRSEVVAGVQMEQLPIGVDALLVNHRRGI